MKTEKECIFCDFTNCDNNSNEIIEMEKLKIGICKDCLKDVILTYRNSIWNKMKDEYKAELGDDNEWFNCAFYNVKDNLSKCHDCQILISKINNPEGI